MLNKKNYNFNKKSKGKKLCLLVFLILILIGCTQVVQDKKDNKDIPAKKENPIDLLKWQKRPVSIIIENFKKARPVSGLLQSRIVYEAPVEGDITRFLAIFKQDDLVKKIGPVRSARPYFLDWAKEYNALFVHAGGSPQALKSIKNGEYSVKNLDEIGKNGNYFFRDYDKSKPHNLYTKKVLINNFLKNKIQPLNKSIKGWYYKKSQPVKNNNLLGVLKIPYREDAVWKYDKDLNKYFRYENGKPLKDAKNNQLHASTIIVQKTNIQTIDEVGRKSIKTQGNGDVIVFKNGEVVKGFWEKLKGDKRTRFYKKNGEEIVLSPGIVWVHIVSDNSEIDYY